MKHLPCTFFGLLKVRRFQVIYSVNPMLAIIRPGCELQFDARSKLNAFNLYAKNGKVLSPKFPLVNINLWVGFSDIENVDYVHNIQQEWSFLCWCEVMVQRNRHRL